MSNAERSNADLLSIWKYSTFVIEKHKLEHIVVPIVTYSTDKEKSTNVT